MTAWDGGARFDCGNAYVKRKLVEDTIKAYVSLPDWEQRWLAATFWTYGVSIKETRQFFPALPVFSLPFIGFSVLTASLCFGGGQ